MGKTLTDDEASVAGMDREFAILILNACYRASREIGEVSVTVQEFSPGEDGNNIRIQAGRVISEIGRITDAVFELHPDLEAYVESRITKFGRVS